MTTEEQRLRLEAAARAAGYDIDDFGNDEYKIWDGRDVYGPWDPEHDDGDAFRLMVDADISIEFPSDGSIEAWSQFKGTGFKQQVIQIKSIEYTDKAAATRKAIYSCAVQIGNTMKAGRV